jgi:hypothetical protein
MPTSKEVEAYSSKVINNYDTDEHSLANYDKKKWASLKLTPEDVLFVKYIYHDRQLDKLDTFIDYMLKVQKIYIRKIDEQRYLTPYILVYDPKKIERFWLITYNLNAFNMSYHKIVANNKSSKTNIIRTYSTAFIGSNAMKAADFFIPYLRSYPVSPPFGKS